MALAGFAASIYAPHPFYVVAAVLALFLLATSFSEASRLAVPLEAFLGHQAEVRVWGAPLPVSGGVTTTITSVKVIGAGLHLFLQVGSSGSPDHLKIAQPGRAKVLPQELIIESAAYVQWVGKRLPRVAGEPAVIISLHSPSTGTG